MRQIILFISVVMLTMVFSPSLMAQKKKSDKETVTFHVDGITCNNCISKIEKNIAFEKGVTDMKCDLKSKTVKVTYKEDKTNPENLMEAFDKLGYPATVMDDASTVNAAVK